MNKLELLINDLCETILKSEAQRKIDSQELNNEHNPKHSDLLMNFLIRFSGQIGAQTQEDSQKI